MHRRRWLRMTAAGLFASSGVAQALANARSIAAAGRSPEEVAVDEVFWASVRSAFDLDHTIMNLNNGGVSPAPRSVIERQRRLVDQTNDLPARNLWQVLEPRQESIRSSLASIFGVNSEELAITRNASESLETLQLGLNLRSGDEVICSVHDYPRMITTWEQRARRDGIILKQVAIPAPLMDPTDAIRAYRDAITPKTRVLHVSHVVFSTGQIMPVREICALARQRGLDCIVDGAHSFAQFPFSQSDLQCQFFGTSLHKWMCGPIGTGMLYVAKERIKDVWPLMAAPGSLDNDIRKFEEIGTHPAALHNALADAIEFHAAIGSERKAARFHVLHQTWVGQVEARERLSFATNVQDPANQCALRLMILKDVDHSKLSAWLMDNHAIFTVPITYGGLSGLRVAPNVYTRIADMVRFGSLVNRVAKGDVTL
ncbi:MAG: aminotransferase class V-fold PLP-dependent enzyme [Candidatus Kapabacteria bacterium]|nr:aminotransferase class V-fold PLP-dependent enzyme [Candidatus Kapabacteria bacterium]